MKNCILKNSDMVSITFYTINAYQQITGMVSEINAKAQYIKVVETKIPFKQIVRID